MSYYYSAILVLLLMAQILDISLTFNLYSDRLITTHHHHYHSRWLGVRDSIDKGLLMATLEPPTRQFPGYSSPSSSSTTWHDRSTKECFQNAKKDNDLKVSTLLIDNYDSYTYNVWQLLHRVNGIEPYVVYNDQFNSWEEMLASVPHFDNIVISPGPGTPTNESDFGLCKEAIIKSTVPVLGVCLGHQGIAHIYGLQVTRGKRPVHGEIFPVHHIGGDKSRLFRDIPDGFDVVRYHSLVVQGNDDDVGSNNDDGDNDNDKNPIRFTAWTEDGDVMALEHKEKPIYGVQFHPESVSSTYGQKLFSNFKDITLQHRKCNNMKGRDDVVSFSSETILPTTTAAITSGSSSSSSSSSTSSTSFASKNIKYGVGIPLEQEEEEEEKDNTRSYVHVSKVHLPASLTFEDVFISLYKKEEDGCTNDGGSFWLDSSLVDATKAGPSLSFAGAVNTQHGGISIEYQSAPVSELIVRSGEGKVVGHERNGTTIFDYIDRFTRLSGKKDVIICDDTCSEDELPFAARRSLFGYIGYEARFEASKKLHLKQSTETATTTNYPTSLYLCPRQFLVYNHDLHVVYIVTSSNEEKKPADVCILRDQILHSINDSEIDVESEEVTTLKAMKSADMYFQDVEKCIEYIRAGETYEVCMTVQFTGECYHRPIDVYKKLRKNNPAPYSCFVSYKSPPPLPEAESDSNVHRYDFSICCSSPERYLRMNDQGIIDSKPIKGTSRRNRNDPSLDYKIAQELATDVKSQAENLMIVDLVRNDLGRVCEMGSIHVPHLMNVESYATVHQLVSTIEGKLDRKKGYSISDAICATFPGGSMTGAPKLRTMDIIDELEKRPRGVYSGTIGYITSDGSSDMNIVIRTAVISKGQITVGAGGAVTALSDPQKEVEEVLLKVNAVAKAIGYKACFASENEEFRKQETAD